MRTLPEIELAIQRLSEKEVRQLSIWLQAYLDELWDQEMESDLMSGKLNHLITKAESEIAVNHVRDLDEILRNS